MAARWWRSGAGNNLAALAASSYPPSLSKAASCHTIHAVPRELTGSRMAARERATGRIPAVIFNQSLLEKSEAGRGSASAKHLITAEREHIIRIMKSVKVPFFCSTRFPIEIRAGSGSSVLLHSGKVLPIKIHRDEETRKLLNLVFVWANDGTELKVDVPIVFKGEDACPGLKKGGHLSRIRESLKYIGPAEHIPRMIEVDVSNLDIGDRIFMRDVEAHPSLKLLSRTEEMPICKIVSTKSKITEPACV